MRIMDHMQALDSARR